MSTYLKLLFSTSIFLIIHTGLAFRQVSQSKKSTGINLPLDPAVRKGTLANGFTYYIRRNNEPRNRVVFYLANKVGSILENDDQRGLAHFMEHMSFNGTKHYPKVSDLNGWNNELCVYFGIKGIPSTLLIDPQGVIIGKNLKGIMLNKKLEVLLNQD